MKILLATANKGKVKEFAELIQGSGMVDSSGIICGTSGERLLILSLNDFPEMPDIEENGQSFAENAMIKARAAFKYTKLLTLADDSGLEVDVLNGAPGIYSARYAGEPKDDERNIVKLLADLEGVPEEKRTARFRCSLAMITPDGRESLLDGTVEGRILFEKKGQGGFGYDPIFFLPELNKTMAELTGDEKNSISHRARAFHQIIINLEESILDKCRKKV